MKYLFYLSALFSLFCCSVHAAQKIGDACQGQAGEVRTLQSDNQMEGIIQCIPDGNGNYWWQAEGGVARYDATATCSVPGIIRWNGSSFQGCFGTQWKSFTSSCHYNYFAREVRHDGNYWHNYGASAFVLCINNAPDSTWEVIGYDECYEDGDKCTPDGQLCFYAQQVCS